MVLLSMRTGALLLYSDMGLFNGITFNNIFKRDAELNTEFKQAVSADTIVKSIHKKDALKINTVYACVNIISSTIASLPFDLYQKTDTGRVKAVKHRLYNLCKYPSLDMSGFNFKESLLVNLLIWGNAYIEIVRVKGQVKELNLIPSEKVEITELADGRVKYTLSL